MRRRSRRFLPSANASRTARRSTVGYKPANGFARSYWRIRSHSYSGQLSDELAGPLATAGEESATELGAEAFVVRVDRQLDDEGVEADARRCVQAVMETLSGAIDEMEWQGLIAQLPGEYEDLYSA